MAWENLDVSRYFCYDFVLFFVIFFFFPLLCSWDDWHSEVFFVLQLSATWRCYRNVIIGLPCTFACFCFAPHCVIYYYYYMYIFFDEHVVMFLYWLCYRMLINCFLFSSFNFTFLEIRFFLYLPYSCLHIFLFVCECCVIMVLYFFFTFYSYYIFENECFSLMIN